MTGTKEPVRPFELDPSRLGATLELPPEDRLTSSSPDGEPATTDLPEAAPRKGRWIGWGLVIGITGVIGLQTVVYLGELMTTAPLVGWPLAILTGLVTVSGAALIGREWRDLRHLWKRSELRDEAARLTGSSLHGRARPLLDEVNRELEKVQETRADIARFESYHHDGLDDGETLHLYERTVLAPIDRKANRLVLESARDIGLLTALSPLGLLDGVLVLWRTMVMLKAIARLYGMAPGPSVSLVLLRRSVRNAALAGLADVITHAATEHIGASLAALLSARAGQGAGNALLSAKLGIEAIRQSRPLPFVAEQPPSLKSVRQAVLEKPLSPPSS